MFNTIVRACVRALALSALVLGVLSGPAAAAPKSKIRFSSGTYFVGESDGEATVKVIRTRNLKTPVSARLTTAPGTATAGTDYTPLDQVVEFPAVADSSKSQSVTIKVPIAADSAIEANETVILSLRPTTSAVAGRSSATLTIVDDDGPPRVSFGTGAFDAAEDSGTATVQIVRAGNLGLGASVAYSVTGGTAPAGDYTLTPGTASFAPGEELKTFTIGLNDNGIKEGARTVVLGLSSPSVDTTLAEPTSSTMTITDDESPSSVRFETSAVTVDEAAGTAFLTVTRAGTYAGSTVTVDYATAAGTAASPDDFSAGSGTVTLEGPDPDVPGDPGDATALIEVPITDDTIQEGDETFTATLSTPGVNAILGEPIVQTVTIAANDAPVVPPVVPPISSVTPTVTTTPTVTPGPTGVTPLKLGVKVLKGKALRRGKIRARISCSQACALAVGGKLKAKKRKAAKLRGVKKTVAAGKSVVVTLKLSKKQRRKVAGRRVKLTVTARGAVAGQPAVRKSGSARFKLRR